MGLPQWLSSKESAQQWRRHGFDPWIGKTPWRRVWQPTPVFVPGESHGQRSLAGYSLQGHKESIQLSDWHSKGFPLNHTPNVAHGLGSPGCKSKNTQVLRLGFPDSSVGKESACDSWVRKIPWRRDRLCTPVILSFPCGSAGKESACNAGDLGSIPGLGRSPGEGKGYPLQYSGLEKSMDCLVHGVTKSWTRLSNLHFHFHKGNWGPFRLTCTQSKITPVISLTWLRNVTKERRHEDRASSQPRWET